MSEIKLPGGRMIGPGHPCFITAEIGQNHQGDVYTALRLAKAAHEAGVDAIKLCKRDISSDMTQAMRNSPYTGPQSFGPTYGKHREALELSPKEYAHLRRRLEYNLWPEILFATVCDCQSVDDIEAVINPPLYKIASRDLDNLPLLSYVARLGKPIVLSTGMATGGQIERALEIIHKCHDKTILLYCVSEYPTLDEHVSLREMRRLSECFDVPIGFSDHTPGIVYAQAAAALGAVMIEKHITLSRAMPGTDHAAALEPDGLRRLVKNIRLVEDAQHRDAVSLDLARTRAKLGRSLTTTRLIRPGTIIVPDMFALKSPGDGIPYADLGSVCGCVARVSIPTDCTLQWSDLQTPAPKGT